MISIVHFIDSMNWGGAETLVLNSVELLNRDGNYKNYIVTLDGGPLKGRAKSIGEFKSLGLRQNGLIKTILSTKKLFRKLKPDIVHSHLLMSTLISRLTIPSRTKLVSSYHSKLHCRGNEHFSKKQFWADKITYRPNFYTIYVSNSVKECVGGPLKIKSNHTVLANFAHESFKIMTPRKPDSSLKLLSIGRLSPQKNFSLAIRALGCLKEYDISLDIYGFGPLNDELTQEINSCNAKVKLIGHSVINSEIFSKYDAFIMTSIHEGMPISLIEALRTGIPCILSDIPELVETAGNSAIYFDVNNQIDLIDKLKLVLENPQRLMGLRENAHRISDQFSPENYIERLKEIYNNHLHLNN